MSTPRAHLNLPVPDSSGSVLPYVTVAVLDHSTGRPLSASLYDADGPVAAVLPNPATFAPGIIDLWLDDPARVDLVIAGPNGYSEQRPGVDLLPEPSTTPLAPTSLLLENAVSNGHVVMTDGTTGTWKWPQFIAPHQHSGSQSGSTMLDKPEDQQDTHPDQTWVGAYSGAPVSGFDTSLSSSLGNHAEPGGHQSTTVGFGATTTGSASPDRSVSLGYNTDAAQDETSLGGHQGGLSEVTASSLAYDSDNVNRAYVAPADLYLRLGVHVSDSRVDLGTVLNTSSTPAQSSTPLVVHQDLAVPGPLEIQGFAQVGGAGSHIGFYSATKVAKPSVPNPRPTSPVGLLATALANYGLITLT